MMTSTSSMASASFEVPSNLYKPTAPLEAKILKNERITAPDSLNDVRHIVFDISGSALRYVEGQSIGILPPGTDKDGKPNKLRLYSIASAAEGDDGKGDTLSLCVKRAITRDEATGVEYHGVCSSFLCNLAVGDTSLLTGPVGKSFLIPSSQEANLIMVATGTGIAPFRAFLRKRHTLLETTGQGRGHSWLFFGAQTHKDYLYESELEAYRQYDDCHIMTAFSREEQNAQGGRLYVQNRLQEQGDAVMTLLRQPNTYFYICGLRGMESGILEGLQQAASQQGIDWNQLFETLKNEKRWHVEVY